MNRLGNFPNLLSSYDDPSKQRCGLWSELFGADHALMIEGLCEDESSLYFFSLEWLEDPQEFYDGNYKIVDGMGVTSR